MIAVLPYFVHVFIGLSFFLSLILVSTPSVEGFVIRHDLQCRQVPTGLYGNTSGQGFGKGSSPKKSYDAQATEPHKDLMDADAAMREFFDAASADMMGIFQAVTQTSVPDTATIAGTSVALPPEALPGIPTEEGHRTVLAEFLDQIQASLISIPVDETTEDDENDMQFLEEGRRMLVCGRFHVLSTPTTTTTTSVASTSTDEASQNTEGSGRIDYLDSLLRTCWQEVHLLHTEDEPDTGSVILVPEVDRLDINLRRFVDVNLQRPLQWMGLQNTFEVASLESGLPAIRVLHKLSDIPTDLSDEAETMSDE